MLYQSLLDNDITRIATIRQSVVFFLNDLQANFTKYLHNIKCRYEVINC
jgi:hypothetical protein